MQEEAEREFKFHAAGEQLRLAREAKNLSVADVAAQTRIAQRHVESLERADYAALPGRTYTIGFARAIARKLDVPEEPLIADLREELDAQGAVSGNRYRSEPDVEDLNKVPSPRIALLAAAIGVALLIAGFSVWRVFFFPAAELGPAGDLTAPTPTAAAAPRPGATPAPATGRVVVFTAQEAGIWVKFYDGAGTQLIQKQMALGEQYTVPPDAQNPQIWTGRPDALQITIDGRPVPPLGTSEMIIKDVPVSATALLARTNAPSPTPTPITAPTPTGGR